MLPRNYSNPSTRVGVVLPVLLPSPSPSPATMVALVALLLTFMSLSLTASLSPPIPRRGTLGATRHGSDETLSLIRNRHGEISACARLRGWTNHERLTVLRASEDDDGKLSSEMFNNEKNGDDASDGAGQDMDEGKDVDGGLARPSILDMINPFNAGKSFRSAVDSAIDLASAITNDSPASRLSPDRRSIYYNYYVDDRLGLSGLELKDVPKYDSPAVSSSWLSLEGDEDRRPEVLVVGASGSLGRVLVKRLLLENKVRVRVLVRDLYSSTLNKLGTGVTYCQGDLSDVESLEYAVTDMDKIVFCAGGRRKGERGNGNGGGWNSLESVLDRRAREARAVDGVGLRNLIHAYQNVRHADYGTSQAAKRALFKFRKRPADFGLFGIDDGSVDGNVGSNTTPDSDDPTTVGRGDVEKAGGLSSQPDRSVAATLSQCDWKTNKFGHGVFAGRAGRHGEAAIASARLRSRNDPEQGIDLRSGGFAGLVCRLCGDGSVYEAFLRTEVYDRLGVEYVCEFRTPSKTPANHSKNMSRTKWGTVRLEFSDFRPRMRRFRSREDGEARRMRRELARSDIPPFVGRDIRQIGFRYRGMNNQFGSSGGVLSSGWRSFYLALDYIKVCRGQPEPEFVYLSDARIPPVVNVAMVKHDLHRLVTSSSESGASYSIIDEEKVKRAREDGMNCIAEETYFKYMGEEMIKQSGLSYTIIRVAGYNAELGTDSSAVRLQKMNKDITPVSRADLAQVIASALLEPNACNLTLYMTKARQRGVLDGDIWQKFARLRSEDNAQAPFQ